MKISASLLVTGVLVMLVGTASGQGFRDRGGDRGGDRGDRDRGDRSSRGGGDFRGGGFPGGGFPGGGFPGGGFPGGGSPGSGFRGGGGFPGGGSPGGGFPGGQGGPGGTPGGFDVTEYMVGRLDANGDGTISPSEYTGRRREQYNTILRNAGFDPAATISASSLREALKRNPPKLDFGRGPQTPGAQPGAASTPGNPAAGQAKPNEPAAKPLVAGFGTASGAAAAVPGFGPPAASTASPSKPAAVAASSNPSPSAPSSPSPPGGASAQQPGDPNGDARMKGFAEGLLRQYDKNKNGTLEKDEWSEMRGGLKESDKNGDGLITVEELTAKLAEYQQRRGDMGRRREDGRPDERREGPPGSELAQTGSPTTPERKFYRALTPQERLPKGLPDWFIRKDTDGDGQISMAEFTISWTDGAATEFAGYDLNNDGVVTPQEALRKK